MVFCSACREISQWAHLDDMHLLYRRTLSAAMICITVSGTWGFKLKNFWETNHSSGKRTTKLHDLHELTLEKRHLTDTFIIYL